MKNPKAWGPGSLKFLFLNTGKFTLQQAEGPSNSYGILSIVLQASAQLGARLDKVTRWSWQIWLFMRKYVFKIELQHDFALYQGFGRAGLCRGRNPAFLYSEFLYNTQAV